MQYVHRKLHRSVIEIRKSLTVRPWGSISGTGTKGAYAANGPDRDGAQGWRSNTEASPPAGTPVPGGTTARASATAMGQSRLEA